MIEHVKYSDIESPLFPGILVLEKQRLYIEIELPVVITNDLHSFRIYLLSTCYEPDTFFRSQRSKSEQNKTLTLRNV